MSRIKIKRCESIKWGEKDLGNGCKNYEMDKKGRKLVKERSVIWRGYRENLEKNTVGG